MTPQRFLTLRNGYMLDLSQVETVTPLQRDGYCQFFTVRFRSGAELKIYEKNGTPRPDMSRQTFIEKLLEQPTP